MTVAQHQELQSIIRFMSGLRLEELEPAFEQRWKPFVQSLSTEEDRVLAFKVFYEWQISQMDDFAKHLASLPLPN